MKLINTATVLSISHGKLCASFKKIHTEETEIRNDRLKQAYVLLNNENTDASDNYKSFMV